MEPKLKIDMSPEAVTRRLMLVDELRRACLILADSSAGREIRRKFPNHPIVARTSRALGNRTADDLMAEAEREAKRHRQVK